MDSTHCFQSHVIHAVSSMIKQSRDKTYYSKLQVHCHVLHQMFLCKIVRLIVVVYMAKPVKLVCILNQLLVA